MTYVQLKLEISHAFARHAAIHKLRCVFYVNRWGTQIYVPTPMCGGQFVFRNKNGRGCLCSYCCHERISRPPCIKHSPRPATLLLCSGSSPTHERLTLPVPGPRQGRTTVAARFAALNGVIYMHSFFSAITTMTSAFPPTDGGQSQWEEKSAQKNPTVVHTCSHDMAGAGRAFTLNYSLPARSSHHESCRFSLCLSRVLLLGSELMFGR